MRRLLLLAAILGMLAPATTAFAEEGEFEVKVATVAPARTPWAKLLKKYRSALKTLTEGRVKMRVYLGGIKGDEQSIVRQVYKGTLHIGGVSTGAMATVVPDLDLLELPYLFASHEEADRILDGPAKPIIEEMLAAKGFKLLMYSENGYRSFGTKNGFVKTPADLKAVKMRSQESPVHVATYRALGAAPVTISVGEVMSSLQTGLVDGFDNTPLFTQAVSWHQAIKYFTVTQHIYQPALVIANKAWFDGLPPDIQAAMLKPVPKLEQLGRKAVRLLGGALLDNFVKLGVEVYTLTDAEKKAFQDRTRPVWSERRAAAGDLGKKLLDAILAAKQG